MAAFRDESGGQECPHSLWDQATSSGVTGAAAFFAARSVREALFQATSLSGVAGVFVLDGGVEAGDDGLGLAVGFS